MADLAQGNHANVVLQSSEALRVEVDGTVTVQAVYGAPDGTTSLTNNSQTFGPYGVPAKLRVQVSDGSATYSLYEPPMTDGVSAVVYVTQHDSRESITSKLATLRPEIDGNSPVGRGAVVQFDPGKYETGAALLSTMQSVVGVKGSTQVIFSPGAIPPSAGESGHFVLADDSLSRAGIRGNGVLRDVDFNGDRQTWEATLPNRIVHGYFAADRAEGKCIAHRIDNAAFYNYTGGVYIGAGNDQCVANRLRVENCGGTYSDGIHRFALTIKSSDCKMHDLGIVGKGGSVLIDGAAPEIETVDFFIPDDFDGECTALLKNAARTQIKGGTISGRTIVRGRNGQGTGVRFESSGILLADLVFKHDQALAGTRFYSGAEQVYFYDSYLEIEDTDGVRLRAPAFRFDRALTASQLPDYLIKIRTATGLRDRLGVVHLSQAIGLVDFTGRPGVDGLRPRMGCKKHWSNEPHLTQFDWGVPGQVEDVPIWACNHPDPTMRTHVRFDGGLLLKADHPFGYLARTINPTGGAHGTLDDANASVVMTALPDLSSTYCRAMRVVP